MNEESLHYSGSPSENDDVAYAAEIAARAVEEADAATAECQQRLVMAGAVPHRVCRICGRGSEDGRPILQFLPDPRDSVLETTEASSTFTFTEDIKLHVFCGKTATILSSVNRPDLEILSKAGLKNKHGIGPDVNAALARTRCATVCQEGAKEKHFYLVREFETHLTLIRQHGIMVHAYSAASAQVSQSMVTSPALEPFHSAFHDMPHVEPPPHSYAPHLDPHFRGEPPLPYSATQADQARAKICPVRATAGQLSKPRRRYEEAALYPPSFATEGKSSKGGGER